MKRYHVRGVLLAVLLGLATSMCTTDKKNDAAPPPVIEAADNATIVKAMHDAMNPGEEQKRLEFLVGTFDVKIRTWVDPSKPPFESTATAVATWVLGNRYVQQMLAGHIMGEPWSGIGYAGFDNVAKKYVATYMDSGSTGMEWFTGALDEAGKLAKMTATIHDEVTGKPKTIELRLSIAAGDHVTELWQGDPNGQMVKVMELQYTRKKS